jgi:hypothetical protein
MARKRRRDDTRAGAPAASRGGPREGASEPRVPFWVPAVLFVVLTAWLFRAFIFSDKMLFGSDTLSLGYVARAFYAHSLKAFSIPRWNPQILGGTPFVEALSGGDSLYPPSAILLFLLAPYRALGWKLVVHIAAAGLFTFGWMRSLKASRAAALVAGTGYMLTPFMVTLVYPGHDGKIFVSALAPLLFWATERLFVRPGAKAVAGVGLVVALVLLTTHFETAYFLCGGVGLYAIFRAVQLWRGTAVTAAPTGERRLAPSAGRLTVFMAAALLGGAAAGVQLLPAAHYVRNYSRRIQTTARASGQTGRVWSSSWGLHPEEAFSEIIPEFAGADVGASGWSANTYWGRNGFKLNSEYVGLVLLLLSVVAFAGGARPGVRWFFAAEGLGALLFALGTHTPVWGLFYAIVPGIRMFRAPSQAMLLFAVAAATLGGLGVDRLLKAAGDDDDALWQGPLRVLWASAGVVVVLALLTGSGALTSFWTSAVYPGITDRQLQALASLQPFLATGSFVAAVLAVGTAGLTWAVRRGFLAPVALVAGLVLLVVVDEARIDAPFIQVEDYQEWATPDPNIKALLDLEKDDPEPYRLLDFVQDAQDVRPALVGIELAAGHHPNDLARYRELIGMVGSGMPSNLAVRPNIRRLLNVRYILWPDYELGPVARDILWPGGGASPTGPGSIVSATQQGGHRYETLLSDAGLPRARLVAKAVLKPDGQDVQYMTSDAFDPATEVVLPEAPPIDMDGGPVTGEVHWEERTPNRLRLHVTSDRAALLVIADNWFPAWHATVDGRDAPVLRAYHTLRAVPLQAGEHSVEMFYRSEVLARSLWLSVVALAILFGLGGWGIVQGRRRPA